VGAALVDERVGHADVTITLRTYRHILEGADPAAADALSTLVLGDSAYPAHTDSPRKSS